VEKDEDAVFGLANIDFSLPSPPNSNVGAIGFERLFVSF